MRDGRLIEMQVFKAVAESGGFTAAGRLLGAGQPFLSRTLSNLEKRLGTTLIRRSTRRMSLTKEGKDYLDSCNMILDAITTAEQSVSSEGASLSGELRVTAGTSFGLDQIVPILPIFMERYPDIRIFLSLSDTHSDVVAERLDVAIRMGKLNDSRLLSRRLCHLQRRVVAAPSYISKFGKPTHPNDLLSHNCMTWQPPLDHLNDWPFKIGGKKSSLRILGNFSHSHGSAGAEMCMAGVAVARIAEHLACPAIREGRLVELLSNFQYEDDTSIYAIYAKQRQQNPRVKCFVKFLVQHFKNPPWQVDG